MYRSTNPQGLVPALIEDDHVLTQSLAICEYLDEQHPEPPLLPTDPKSRAAVQAIAIAICISLIFGVLGMVYSRRVLAMMGGSAETVRIGAPYTFVMYGSMFVVLLLFINNAIFRAAGDA